MKVGRKPGTPKTGGRKKGSTNKVTADVKAAIVEAFHRAGGADYLTRLAESHPHVFCQLVSKIIPAEVKAEITGKDGGPIITEVTIEHHGIPAAIESADGRSDGRTVDAAISSGPNASMEVSFAVPVDLGGNSLGENVLVPVVAPPGNQEPWIR